MNATLLVYLTIICQIILSNGVVPHENVNSETFPHDIDAAHFAAVFSDGLHICIDYAITSNFTNDGHKKARIDCCVELQPKAGNATEVLS